MKVEIWSDVVCPWCYIGKRRFEAALGRFAHADQVEVEWRSFELDPHATSVRAAGEGPDHADVLASKYGMSRAQAEAAIGNVTAAAAGEGLDFHLDASLRSNTFDAHRVIHLAAARGIQDAVKERLMRAYFTEGEPVGDRDALVRIATDAGLDAAEVEKVLDTDEHADAVRADEAEARALGITRGAVLRRRPDVRRVRCPARRPAPGRAGAGLVRAVAVHARGIRPGGYGPRRHRLRPRRLPDLTGDVTSDLTSDLTRRTP